MRKFSDDFHMKVLINSYTSDGFHLNELVKRFSKERSNMRNYNVHTSILLTADVIVPLAHNFLLSGD